MTLHPLHAGRVPCSQLHREQLPLRREFELLKSGGEPVAVGAEQLAALRGTGHRFLDYVAAIGGGPLFPGIAPGSRGGGRAHTFAKRFPAYRRERGVTRPGVVFHSFRKCFVRAHELADVDRDRAAPVVGHERGFTFRVYNPEGLDPAMPCCARWSSWCAMTGWATHCRS